MIQRFLEMLLKRRWQGFKVVHHAILPAQEPIYGALREPLPEPLQESLSELGITRLYKHQCSALEHIRSGSHVVVASPTASGKSLVYNLAVSEALIRDPEQRALYLFPIKALSRDQLEALNTFFKTLHPRQTGGMFRAAVYDGDTTPYQRSKIRGNHPHVLLTNPDMLHYALLPYHSKWEAFWKKLRFVIVDEMHTYRGIFGSHVAQIFQRLQRICRFYGNSPQFILLSATIANPQQLAQQLIGKQAEEIEVVPENGAPQAKRHFVFMESEEGLGGHTSGLAAHLVVKAAEAGLKTIAFTQSRKMTELIHMSILRAGPQLADRVSSYRAGFLPEERRTIEQKLAGGQLSAVVSTSALEMGIDIGGLDLCILAGYPGTVMNTWQRGGRAGRSGRESAIILLPQYDALDQYIVHHPQAFLDSSYEIAVTDPLNEEILKAHIPCAAAELPLESSEVDGEEPPFRNQVDSLTRTGKLVQTGDGKQWLSAAAHPHRQIDIRSVGPAYVIVKSGKEDRTIPLGKSEGVRALKECHPGAIYLHRGETYQVQTLDLANRVIRVDPSQAAYFTRVKSEKETEILELLASKPVGNFLVRLGRLRVTETITGYERRRLFTQELLGGLNELELPPQTFETVGFWIEIEPEVVKRIQAAKLHFMGGIHAVEHAAISMFPLFALCDRNDIGGISTPAHAQVEKAAIFIYDGYPGGIGLAARGYEIILPLLEKTKDLIASCPCPEGCPACIHSPKCGSGNKPLDKEAALTVLKYLLGEMNFSTNVTESEDGEYGSLAKTVKPQPPAVPRIGFFDIETQRLADEVGGWQNKHLMRVSVAVLYETHTDTFKIFREEDIGSFLRDLQELDLVVGFNIVSFDYQVLRAYASYNLQKLPTFDLLQEIHQVLGFRLSLSHLAENNFGKGKTSDGIQAVKWFREGEWEALIEHCKLDVVLTRDLFFRALENGHLLYSDRTGRTMRVPTPWDLEDLLSRSPGRRAQT